MKRLLALLSLALALVVLAAACGGGAAPTPTPTPQPRATPTPTPSTGDAASGKQIAAAKGCLACHSADGSTLVGPTWKGLYGQATDLADGSKVTADDAYITESIKNPGAKVVKGFQNIMPPLVLTDDEIKAVIAYIKTLK